MPNKLGQDFVPRKTLRGCVDIKKAIVFINRWSGTPVSSSPVPKSGAMFIPYKAFFSTYYFFSTGFFWRHEVTSNPRRGFDSIFYKNMAFSIIYLKFHSLLNNIPAKHPFYSGDSCTQLVLRLKHFPPRQNKKCDNLF